MKFISPTPLLFAVCSAAFSQGFIAEIDDDDIGTILKSPTKVILQSGDTLHGELTSASLINGYLKNVTLKQADGTKRKLQPEEMSSLWVKASDLAKMAMMNESGSSVFRLTKTNFDDIINREYIIFEYALRATKKDKPAMMQLLNPGFDNLIKVYADPNANETDGLSIGGVALTGGKDKLYLFVKGTDKVVIVKKGSYKKSFDDLYGDCQQMMITFEGEKKKFNDMAGHVFAYDQICNK